MIARRVTQWVGFSLLAAALLGVLFSRAPIATGSVAAQPTPQSSTYLPLVTRRTRPNFVIIVSDDQRYDTLDYMPLTQSMIFDRGVTFTNTYVTTPLCCPSRSTILTGMYAHHHQVYDNFLPLNETTFVQRLHDAGYFTGIVGKYLNSWDGTPRPEFDDWVVFAGHGSAQRYFDPMLNVNGEWIQHTGYMTTILQDYVLSFLDKARRREAPFLLIFTPNAPHEPADPAPGDENLYPDLPLYRPPSFMEEDMTDKPVYLQARQPTDPAHVDVLRRNQLQSLHSLDGVVANILNTLAANGATHNTVVMYVSDNAVFWAEHRLDGKLYAYDEAAHVPFAIRYDALISQPRVDSKLVGNVDIAPTLYDLAGVPLPPGVDGRSLVPLLTQPDISWRTSLLIEGWAYYHYMALRTDRYLYIETDGDTSELYDSVTDPYQLQNQYTNSAYAPVIADLHAALLDIRSHTQPAPRWLILPFLMSAFGIDD